MKNKIKQKKLRHLRVKKAIGTNYPRISIFRSAKYIYAQIIDDSKCQTIIASSDIKFSKKNKLERASEVGQNLAQKAIKKNIKKVVFDRAGYKYHGRVKALAEGARKGGLVF